MINTEKVVNIVKHYGETHQMYKAAEELSELQTLVLQGANKNGKIPIGRIIKEIADVYVMLKQVEIIFEIDSRNIQPMIDYKIERTLSQIGL